MKLFDFIKIFFNTSNRYEKLSKHERSKHRFLIQRFMSIQYPITSNALNINGTNPTYVNDSFRLVGKQFTRTPGWIYTKVRKTKKNKRIFEPREDTIEFYLKKNDATLRDYNEILKSPRKKDMLEELKELEKLLKKHGYYTE